MDEDNLASAEQLLRNNDRTKSVGGPAACIPDNVRISFLEPEDAGWIDPRIHAGNGYDFTGRREGKMTIVELGSVLLVGGFELFCDRSRHVEEILSNGRTSCGYETIVRRAAKVV